MPAFDALQEVAALLLPEWQRPAGPRHALTMAALAGYHIAAGATAAEAVTRVKDAEASGALPLSVLEANGICWYIGGSCAGAEQLQFTWNPRQIHPSTVLALLEAGAHLPEWADGLPRSDSWHTLLQLRPDEDPPELLTGLPAGPEAPG